ncbi:alpha/beta fold hydrolase [Brevibacillus porteri]|uniref:alpha/beta fold hydrolase n=1 Tax=Brevibacillus porteri TaxID=2126350 RepID=UPI003D1E67F5
MRCEVNGVNLYYEEIGSGFPVVMIHGFSLDHRCMTGCLEPIFEERSGYRRLYIDLPGMGQTENYEHIHTTEDILEVVLAFIDQLIPGEPFFIAGESYGGYLTRAVIEKRRDQVKGALFICPNVIPDKEKRTLPDKPVLIEEPSLWEKLSETERAEFEPMAVVATEYTWNRYKKEIVDGYMLSDPSFLSKIRQSYGVSFPLDTAPFHHPSLFVVGKQDHSVGYRDIWDIIEGYPRSSFAALDCAGHNLQIEQPLLFTELVNEWLDRAHRELSL